MTALLSGIDGRKMSKSYNNHIPMFLDPAARRKLVMKIVTDSKTPEEPKNPDENIVFQLYTHFATLDETAAMRNAFLKSGMGYGDAKKKLCDVLDRVFEKPTAVYNDYMTHPEKLDALLKAGAERARAVAGETLAAAKKAAVSYML